MSNNYNNNVASDAVSMNEEFRRQIEELQKATFARLDLEEAEQERKVVLERNAVVTEEAKLAVERFYVPPLVSLPWPPVTGKRRPLRNCFFSQDGYSAWSGVATEVATLIEKGDFGLKAAPRQTPIPAIPSQNLAKLKMELLQVRSRLKATPPRRTPTPSIPSQKLAKFKMELLQVRSRLKAAPPRQPPIQSIQSQKLAKFMMEVIQVRSRILGKDQNKENVSTTTAAATKQNRGQSAKKKTLHETRSTVLRTRSQTKSRNSRT